MHRLRTSMGHALRHAAVFALVAAAPLAAQTKLLRFPDIHGDHVVFTYAGDLWTAPATGGTAVRLTASPGLELFAKYSPDGRWIAFTGQYDGDEQVYVIPAEGGVPKQLTFYPARGPLPPRWGYDNQVYGWTPDGKAILFRSNRDSWDLASNHLYTVPAEGGLPMPLPMPQAGAGDYSPDGRQVVYSPLFRDFRAWKRYQGGWAEDLWTFDLASHAARNITNEPFTDRDPMWIGGRIYFASDRSGTLNLYTTMPDGSDVRQLTTGTTWDVRWPSADEAGRIVYELDGELHVFDTRAGADRKLDILVPDDGLAARPRHESVARYVEDWALSPHGTRAAFTARGDIFTVPAEHGATRNLTHSSDAHDRGAAWSPDGRKIAFISDMSGEEEVYLADQDGHGVPERLTTDGAMRRDGLVWSPDGKYLALTDKSGRLWALEVGTKRLTQVARDSSGQAYDQTWSPDSRWLTFSLSHENGFRSLYVWGVADHALHPVTDPMSSSYEPVFDPEGKYLFFLSDREYAPLISSLEWDYAGNRTTGIFALALRKDVPPPFPPRSDEVAPDTAAAGAAAHTPPPPAIGARAPTPAARPRTAHAGRYRLRRARRPHRPGPRSRRQLQLPVGGQGEPPLRPPAGVLLRPLARRRGGPDDLQPRRPQGDQARRGRRRLRALPRRVQSAGARGRVVRPLRREPQGRGLEDRRFHRRAPGRRRAAAGVGRDFRGGVAAVPRLLLRRQHERLRLEGAARPLPAAAPLRRRPLGPRLRSAGDDRRAEQFAHVHLGRRLRRRARPGPRRPARGAVRAGPGVRALPHHRHHAGRQRRGDLPRAADPDRRGRARGRLPPRH